MMPRSSRGLLSGESTNHLGKSEEEELPEPIKLPSAGAIALRGKITHDDGETILAGNWAEDKEELLSEGGYTEQFKYKNIRSSDNDLSGRFYGGFKYDGTDVVDNNLLLSFEPNNRGSYNVTGSGVNVFGSFDIKGILHQDGLVDMRRKYTKQCEAAVKSNNTFKKKGKPRGKGRKRKVEKTSIQASELGEDLSTILSIAKDVSSVFYEGIFINIYHINVQRCSSFFFRSFHLLSDAVQRRRDRYSQPSKSSSN